MVKGCGGYSTLDPRLLGHRIMVCYCVAQGSQLVIPSQLDTVGVVLAGDHWRTHQDRIQVLMTPRLQELRLKELTKGLDVIKKHIAAGNLERACERLYAIWSEMTVIKWQRRKRK